MKTILFFLLTLTVLLGPVFFPDYGPFASDLTVAATTNLCFFVLWVYCVIVIVNNVGEERGVEKNNGFLLGLETFLSSVLILVLAATAHFITAALLLVAYAFMRVQMDEVKGKGVAISIRVVQH